MKLVAGIDIGSLTAKIIVLAVFNGNKNDIQQKYSFIRRVGYNPTGVADNLVNKAIKAIKPKNLDYVISTGYGRKLAKANENITEITCHAKGAFFVNSRIRTIIDIGGQDSKVIQINKLGQVQDFEMNDKCSAGTGRFLEVMASALEAEIADFGDQALISSNPTPISSICTVFAESEVISRLNQGANRLDIIAGIHKTIATKITALSARVGINPLVALTGGVALNLGVKKMLEDQLGVVIKVPDHPQMIGALGAALIATERL
ncbi:MAG: acyl-CoA dehydratase activase [Candidatus Hodarchaeota archaeon]